MVRVDGVRIAERTDDFLRGSAVTSLNVTADGSYLALGTAWTGAANPSVRATSDGSCTDWTVGDASATGVAGDITEAGARLFNDATLSCLEARHIYCLQTLE